MTFDLHWSQNLLCFTFMNTLHTFRVCTRLIMSVSAILSFGTSVMFFLILAVYLIFDLVMSLIKVVLNPMPRKRSTKFEVWNSSESWFVKTLVKCYAWPPLITWPLLIYINLCDVNLQIWYPTWVGRFWPFCILGMLIIAKMLFLVTVLNQAITLWRHTSACMCLMPRHTIIKSEWKNGTLLPIPISPWWIC